ncbi:MAG: hypothetical protein O2884_12865 [Chloroflexi bacterium]|jgi:hypothetical protein|nr:hypothetical protein [Chloroflexota bacterium]
MFVVRRIHHAKPGQSRKLAEVLRKIGEMYQGNGERKPSRIYTSGGSTPGALNTVYMEWLEEALMSPYRPELVTLEPSDGLFAELKEHEESSSEIEFYELFSGE